MNLSPIVILRREYFELTQNHCAAKLIEYFLHWTNWKIQVQRTEWIYQPLKRIYADLMGEHSLHVIRSAIALLENMGILTKRNNPSNGQDKTYQYKLNQDILRMHLEREARGAEDSVPQTSHRECKNESSEFNAEQHTQISYSNSSNPQQQDTAAGEEKNVEPDWDAIAQQSLEWEETQVKTITEPFDSKTELLTNLSLQVVTTQVETELLKVIDSVVIEERDVALPIESTCKDRPSPRQLEADTTLERVKEDADDDDCPTSPSREEINQVYDELRNLQCPGGIKLNETIRVAIRTNWQNVQGAIAFIKEKIATNKQPTKTWEAWFMVALKKGLTGNQVAPTGFKEWYSWAYKQGFVEGSEQRSDGVIGVCLRVNVAAQLGENQWIRYEKAVELLGGIS